MLRHAVCAAVFAFLLLSAAGAAQVRVVSVTPHSTEAFTQGLAGAGGRLFESTGLYGRSSVRELDPETGSVLRQRDLPAEFFGEGLALVGDTLVQLTWREGTAFIYDADTFELLGEHSYGGEGWGLCHDGDRLVMSDGTDSLQFRDPGDFTLLGTLQVTHEGRPVSNLNDLACRGGRVWANVWLTTYVVEIAPDGTVEKVHDFRNLLSADEWAALGPDAVLNGLHWDEDGQVLLVTGKLWPKMFRLKLD